MRSARPEPHPRQASKTKQSASKTKETPRKTTRTHDQTTHNTKKSKTTPPSFTLEILPNAATVAEYGAAFLAKRMRDTLATQKTFTFAASGGTTPWQMFELLAKEDLPWKKIHLFQTDERILPATHPERNLTSLRRIFGSLPHLHPMPVNEQDLDRACLAYTEEFQRVMGARHTLDLVHLGLGNDGHTASLFPGDPILEETRRKVGLSTVGAPPQRMTLTLPLLNRAKCVLWIVTGKQKSVALQKLLCGDLSIPASRIACEEMHLVVDDEAASRLAI